MSRAGDKKEFFLRPVAPLHRQYEALRAYIVDGKSAAEVADQLGYSVTALRSLVRDFCQSSEPKFFLEPVPGPKARPKKDAVKEKVIELRKQNHSIYDIQRILERSDCRLSHTAIHEILCEEGFARLPKRSHQQIHQLGSVPLDQPAIADVKDLGLAPGRQIHTELGGLFLFVPSLVDFELDHLVKQAGYPGSKMIPAVNAILSLLALKLVDKERLSHVNDMNFDEGAGLFAGLNILPKSTYVSTYSYMTERAMDLRFLQGLIKNTHEDLWVDAKIFNLDFHPIPHRGTESVLEKHWIPSKGKAGKSVLAFFAQEAQQRILCYSNTAVARATQSQEIIVFAEFWKKVHGRYPERLIFDSKLTTYAQLNWLNRKKIYFMTIRKRGSRMLQALANQPAKAWKSYQLPVPKRKFQKVRVLESLIQVTDYEGTLRQLAVTDQGRQAPTFFLTNDLESTVPDLLLEYAQRNRLENTIGQLVNFFHLDCLSSSIVIKVDLDVTITVLASLLYRRLAQQLPGFEACGPKAIFRKFVQGRAVIHITETGIEVRFSKHAHNPILKAARLDQPPCAIPWLGNRKLALTFP